MAGDDPDIIIGCAGGGYNFAGLVFPFLGEQMRGGKKRQVIAVEPAACPTLTRGTFAYDFGDTAHLTPLVKMHTLGSTFIPSGIHAGGLRYHGMSPLVSHLVALGLVKPVAYHQTGCFEAGLKFARAEGIVPAPEATHAVKAAIDQALKCNEEGTSVHPKVVSESLGHSNIGITLDTYSHVLPGMQEDAAAKIDVVLRLAIQNSAND